jgi:hypothetical protein
MSRWVPPRRTDTAHGGPVQLRWDGVPVAAVGHQRLRGHHPGHGEHGRVRAGIGASGSALATVATVARPSAVARIRTSPRVAHHVSSSACASSTVTSSGTVRQNRCAATWLAFSTTPLRFPRRGGHGLTVTP